MMLYIEKYQICYFDIVGAWAAETARLADLSLPLCALKHAYVVTESMPDVEGLPNIRDGDSSIYIRINKDNMFVGGFENNPVILNQVSCSNIEILQLLVLTETCFKQGFTRIFPLVSKGWLCKYPKCKMFSN